MDDRDQKLREHAYKIWEDEGRPEGSHEDHWRRAEQQHGTSEKENIEGIENWKVEAGETEEEHAPVWPSVITPD
jgi:pyrroloquinoline quinone (PQQ) biosynthesis protein C